MSNKDDLLKELKELGVHGSGRKKRSDAGKPRNQYIRKTDQPRADAGKSRPKYDKTPAFYRNTFHRFLNHHTTEDGDNLTRDNNGIYPPHITHYYKLIRPLNAPAYRSSVKRPAHPQKLHWQWWISAYQQEKDPDEKAKWARRISQWYFIKPSEIDLWTYDEWAWAYHTQINGDYNRPPVVKSFILSYDDYVDGKYTLPTLNEEGEIVWRNQ